MLTDISKEQQYLILGLIAAVIIGSGVMVYSRFFAPSPSGLIVEEPDNLPKSSGLAQYSEIEVHVSGAVKKSGVYKLKKGDRIYDALKAAGGSLSSADLDALNLAEPLNDGQKIVIPKKSQNAYNLFKENNPSSPQGGPVNLNTADLKALDGLPGIGPATAQKIIAYRQSQGSFKTLEELMEVPGIRQGKFEKLKKLITVY